MNSCVSICYDAFGNISFEDGAFDLRYIGVVPYQVLVPLLRGRELRVEHLTSQMKRHALPAAWDK